MISKTLRLALANKLHRLSEIVENDPDVESWNLRQLAERMRHERLCLECREYHNAGDFCPGCGACTSGHHRQDPNDQRIVTCTICNLQYHLD